MVTVARSLVLRLRYIRRFAASLFMSLQQSILQGLSFIFSQHFISPPAVFSQHFMSH